MSYLYKLLIILNLLHVSFSLTYRAFKACNSSEWICHPEKKEVVFDCTKWSPSTARGVRLWDENIPSYTVSITFQNCVTLGVYTECLRMDRLFLLQTAKFLNIINLNFIPTDLTMRSNSYSYRTNQVPETVIIHNVTSLNNPEGFLFPTSTLGCYNQKYLKIFKMNNVTIIDGKENSFYDRLQKLDILELKNVTVRKFLRAGQLKLGANKNISLEGVQAYQSSLLKGPQVSIYNSSATEFNIVASDVFLKGNNISKLTMETLREGQLIHYEGNVINNLWINKTNVNMLKLTDNDIRITQAFNITAQTFSLQNNKITNIYENMNINASHVKINNNKFTTPGAWQNTIIVTSETAECQSNSFVRLNTFSIESKEIHFSNNVANTFDKLLTNSKLLFFQFNSINYIADMTSNAENVIFQRNDIESSFKINITSYNLTLSENKLRKGGNYYMQSKLVLVEGNRLPKSPRISATCEQFNFERNIVDEIEYSHFTVTSKRVVFHRNNIVKLHSEGFSLTSINVSITQNNFTHVYEQAFKKIVPGSWGNFNQTEGYSTFEISNNTFIFLANNSITIKPREYYYNYEYLIIKNNIFMCSCKNLYWFESLLERSSGDARFRNILFSDENHNNCDFNHDCSIKDVMKNYMLLCENREALQNLCNSVESFTSPTLENELSKRLENGEDPTTTVTLQIWIVILLNTMLVICVLVWCVILTYQLNYARRRQIQNYVEENDFL